ncbi:MAG: protein kinase [Buchananella hordeovulneris]|nr:protein kinase [Buchananella hordeovulneris]
MASTRPEPPVIPNAEYRKHLGSGGFADVFLYAQRMPRRDVAVKVLKRNITAEQSASFEAEANLMAEVSHHPSIVSVFSANVTDDGRSYLVMEYCPPPHLGRRAKERTYSVPQVLEIGIRIAGAVETLHRRGILHRDIKPANILLTQFDHPVLTDFGIAVSTADGTDSESGFSIPWAPPEQQTGAGPFGPSLDVYSLAATLHTVLTGHSPFEVPGGDNREFALINRVLSAPVPPTGRPDVPQELERILAIAMAKDPTQRYRSVYEFALALQQVQVNLHQTPTPIEVEETGNAPVVDDGDDSDRTAAAPITVIDPMAAPAGQAATRGGGGSAVAPAATSSNWGQTGGGSWQAPTQSAVPAKPFGLTPPSHTQPDDRTRTAAGEVDEATRMAGGVSVVPTTFEIEATRGTPAQQMPQAEENATPTQAGAAKQKSASLASRLAVAAVSLAAVAGIAFGVWSFLRGEGATEKPADQTTQDAPADLPVDQEVKMVEGLEGKYADGKVTFTWKEYAPGASYLYRIVDPLGDQEVRPTKDTSVTVDPIPGRTCLEVVVRADDGTSTEPVIACVENP